MKECGNCAGTGHLNDELDDEGDTPCPNCSGSGFEKESTEWKVPLITLPLTPISEMEALKTIPEEVQALIAAMGRLTRAIPCIACQEVVLDAPENLSAEDSLAGALALPAAMMACILGGAHICERWKESVAKE